MKNYIYKNTLFPRAYLSFDAKDEAEAWAMIVTLTTRPKEWTIYTEKDMIDDIVQAQKRCKHPKVRKLAGCEDCPDWSGCDHEKVRY